MKSRQCTAQNALNYTSLDNFELIFERKTYFYAQLINRRDMPASSQGSGRRLRAAAGPWRNARNSPSREGSRKSPAASRKSWRTCSTSTSAEISSFFPLTLPFLFPSELQNPSAENLTKRKTKKRKQRAGNGNAECGSRRRNHC